MAEGVCVDRDRTVNETILGSSSEKNILVSVGVPSSELELFIFNGRKVSGEVRECDSAMGQEDEESISSEEDNCRKKRCADRYDSSESSDSGVAVHCGDCGSSSDITEPCSPLSETSLEEMPPTQSQPTWPWSEGETPAKRPKQGKITEYFKSKGKKVLEKSSSQVSKCKFISKFLSSTGGSKTEVEEEVVLVESPPPPDLPPASTPISAALKNPLEDTLLRPILDSTIQDISPVISDNSSPSSTEDKASDSNSSSLQEERTIRFPVQNGWNGHFASDVVCRWSYCEAKFTSSVALVEHLQVHINSQGLGETYVCQWVGCRVYNKKSCSRTWLERHVPSHGGKTPYKCIVDGCGKRFSNAVLLQKHVNNHFAEDLPGNSRRSCELNNRLIRRNGKKLRYRRTPFSARIYDFFDAGIMEGLQHKLIELTERRTRGEIDSGSGHTVTLHSKVMGRRTDTNGEAKVLLRWFPLHVLCDEWVDASKVERTRKVNISSLPIQSKDCLYTTLLSSSTKRPPPRHRRKTTSSTSTSSSPSSSASSSPISSLSSPDTAT